MNSEKPPKTEKSGNREGDKTDGVKKYGKDKIGEGDLVKFNGELHRVVGRDTGYTIRQYFSHETPEKGPGPGWDTRWSILEKYGVEDPKDLPNEPYVKLELVPIDKKDE